MNRRDFIKRGVVGLSSVGVGAGLLSALSPEKEEEEEEKEELEAVPIKEKTIELGKWAKEGYFYSKLSDGRVRCKKCPHRCLLKKNYRGACRTNVNKDGVLYSKSYGNPCVINIDPIEKKPFYHFLPATKAFSLATAGCNLRCHYCQNWDISQKKPEETRNYDLPPEKLVEVVVGERNKDPQVKSIAYTYSDPVAFYEYMIDTSILAKKQGIYNTVITAGYIEKKPLKKLIEVVDAIKIDLKGFDEDFYKKVCSAELEYVLDACEIVAQSGRWFEIVNLVVPTLNDNPKQIEKMCVWLAGVSTDIPLHFSRFSPQYKLPNLPSTPFDSLYNAYKIAKDCGINYVYIGNVQPGEWSNTYCPGCKKLIVERQGYTLAQNLIQDSKCSYCKTKIPGVWK
ncbi:AmmeMemoRadiSam system radical SAM enzyme [bacterium]|nr:AmmeMemoRadiSam system radical SAM enzyme [bacterium]MBU1598677.1 AmmeMemoRadiSam system radical SAM enzyme [bacterium]